jgi:hypothetical protein
MLFLNIQLAQIAANSSNENVMMAVGLTACLATFALLLWKTDSKSHA